MKREPVSQKSSRQPRNATQSKAIAKAAESFLTAQPNFDISHTSLHEALQQDETIAAAPPELQPKIVEHLKALQRTRAISPDPETADKLIKRGITSAYQVAKLTQKQFVAAHGKALGESKARTLHANAIASRIANEQTLMAMHEAVHGTGIRAIDGDASKDQRAANVRAVLARHAAPFDLSALIGGTDLCNCDDCNSVFSLAAYFVELLEYLRSNNLDTAPPGSNPKGIAHTALEQLLRRRPDLACIELTCQNSLTELPWIDLANEVMESFIVHLDEYEAETQDPKQATIEAYNIIDEPSAELTAQPENTNYPAYCRLKNAPYPFSLPYHQPIDNTRILLDFMKTSRRDLLQCFATATEDTSALQNPADAQQLLSLHVEARQSAEQAEALGITQEDFIILTHEAFWPKAYFDLTVPANPPITVVQYETNIGVRPLPAYYGYASAAELLDTDPQAKAGLTFVAQFLRRSGVSYTDLVAILQTRAINPGYPQGRALQILESLQESYRFMQTLVDTTATTPAQRFAKLIPQLQKASAVWPKLDALLHPDPCHDNPAYPVLTDDEIADWITCWFDRVGQLIVIESGEGPTLSIAGDIHAPGSGGALGRKLATLAPDGTVTDLKGKVIGHVLPDGEIVATNGQPLTTLFKQSGLVIVDAATGQKLGLIAGTKLVGTDRRSVTWSAATDSCDLSKARLLHLDGSAVSIDEYDRLQRFIRLKNRLGWTADELDKALVGQASPAAAGPIVQPAPGSGSSSSPSGFVEPGVEATINYGVFADDCTAVPASPAPAPAAPPAPSVCPQNVPTAKITRALIGSLAAIKDLQADTGYDLVSLLALWADISTDGPASLYARLFLTFNVSQLDPVFKSDVQGNYLSSPAAITDHIPALMAAMQLSAADIKTIMALRQVADQLTLANLSILFRHALLARMLGVQAIKLPRILALFGDPLTDPATTLGFRRDWQALRASNFTYQQLDYIVTGTDDPVRPIGPTLVAQIQLARTVRDGLQAIAVAHPDPADGHPEQVSDDAVRSAAELLYDATTVGEIIATLDGQTTATVTAPVIAPPTIPPNLVGRLLYRKSADGTTATLQMTGILAAADLAAAIAMVGGQPWTDAINNANAIVTSDSLFTEALDPVFANPQAARAALLEPDVIVPASAIDPNQPDPNTAPSKRAFFLAAFLPFLRRRLGQQLIVDTVSAQIGAANDVTLILLRDILKQGSEAALDVLLDLATTAAPPALGDWSGYLFAPATDAFTFVDPSGSAASFTLDGQTFAFGVPVSLKSGRAYPLTIAASAFATLAWKRTTAALTPVPASAVLDDEAITSAGGALVLAKKAGLVANGFGLDGDEVTYLQAHGVRFDGLDFNAVTLPACQRLLAYQTLRDALPAAASPLIALFKASEAMAALVAGPPPQAVDPAAIAAAISASTGWDPTTIRSLMAPAHFNFEDPVAFTDERAMVKLAAAMDIVAKTQMDADSLFAWADPGSQFWPCRSIAQAVRRTLQSRYTPSDWVTVVKPLNDKLRANQQAALNAYLLAQEPIAAWGAKNADDLLEFFLIDTQMSSCMPGSRIRLAIAAVQLYVWRCQNAFEEPYVKVDALDRQTWAWMGDYQSWALNRQIFVFPENSLQSSLRDDKSPFYRDLESALLQKDIDTDLIEAALAAYIYQVDEVANLTVAGLHLAKDRSGDVILHIFARTRNLPGKVFYRRFDFTALTWSAWEQVQVEIPTYDAPVPTDPTGATTVTGLYLCPVVWRNRLFLFFPEFTSKTAQNATIKETKISDIGGKKSSEAANSSYWDITLAWSEYRSGQWTQKQVSNDSVQHGLYPTLIKGARGRHFTDWSPTNTPLAFPQTELSNIGRFLFVPRGGTDQLGVDVHYVDVDHSQVAGPVARFAYSGSELHRADTQQYPPESLPTPFNLNWIFQRRPETAPAQLVFSSLQAPVAGPPPLALNDTAAAASDTVTSSSWSLEGQPQLGAYPYAGTLVADVNDDIPDLYTAFTTSMTGSGPTAADDRANNYGAEIGANPPLFNELRRPYSLYNWELGFHAPLAISAKLASSGQWDQAFALFHTVFDPGSGDSDLQRTWKFPPFKLTSPDANVEAKFLSLQPNAYDKDITAWRKSPFNPHLVARSRPVAYMKWTVIQYVQMLVDRGDDYFRQYSFDTIELALQNYILALDVLGPRPQTIPKRGNVRPETYCSLLDKWDAFGNAMVEMELLFPFSNQTTAEIAESNGVIGLPTVFGFATSLYFCIPPNTKLAMLRSLIEDRIYNIRHCRDINGNVRKLSLFGTADAALQALAAELGVTLADALDDLSTPTPNYRFNYLLQKAYGYVAETKALASTFLSSWEKGDAESLSAMRAAHETNLYQLTLNVRQQQQAEAEASLAALQQSREGPVNRLQHYLRLIGADLDKVPEPDATYDLIADPIEAPSQVSGLVLSDYEKEEMVMAAAAAAAHDAVGHLESIGGILSLIPQFVIDIAPIGVGTGTEFGGHQLSSFTQATARIAQTISDELSFASSNAARKSGYLRQLQDRVLQANIAGLEIMSIDKQIATQQVRVKIAELEVANQKKQIEDAQAVEDFLATKYTRTDLYDWMQTSLRSLHYQAYSLAYDMAGRAQAVFNFERGTDKNFVIGGYWDNSRDGMFSGEKLELALKAMEADYVHDRPHDMELTRPPFSLKEIDPLALIALRATGSCTFTLNEALFDRETPGQYLRRIKALAIDLPCVVGPGVSVAGTLTLVSHRFRTSTDLSQNGYAEDGDGQDPRFATRNIPIDIIALCSGQNDHGAFEMTFNGERYLPFEGAGALSTWQIDLQPDFRPFDYDTIADVRLHMTYVSNNGDKKFASAAAAQVKSYQQAQFEGFTTRDGYFFALELPRDFPDAWYQAAQTNPPASRTFSIDKIADRLPYAARFLSGQRRASSNLQAYGAYFVYDTALQIDVTSLTFAGTGGFAQPPSPLFQSSVGLNSLGIEGRFDHDTWDFTFDLTAAPPPGARAWLIIRYSMT